MNNNLNNILLPYLEKRQWTLNKRGKVVMVLCPKCKKEPLSANFIPFTNKIKCFNCSSELDLFELVRLIEPAKGNLTDEQLTKYISELFQLNIETESDKAEIDQYLKLYKRYNWALVPVAKNDKKPIEKNWTSNEHRDRIEWEQWLQTGLNIAVRTGEVNNLTVIDIDTQVIPEDIKQFLGNTLVQQTNKGFHFFYKYVAELPKTRIDELKIDIENNGGAITLFPSTVFSIKRKFIATKEVQPMPLELLNYLKSKITVPRQTQSEKTAEEIQLETYHKPLLAEGDGRNDFFIHLGGMLRKQLNLTQTEYTLKVLNKVICKTPLQDRELEATVNSLDRYTKFDEQELAHKIYNYLKIVEFANSREVREAIGDGKEAIDKALAYLTKEGYLIKRSRNYHVIKKMEWNEKLVSMGKPLNFKMPYFDDVATFAYGDLALISSLPKFGKTHLSLNIVKRLVEQGIKPYYLYLESGSRFTQIALKLGLKEGDFFHAFCADPTKIELEPNAVTIIDWLLVIDKCTTDMVFKHFVEQLVKTQGFLIVFQQLKEVFIQSKNARPQDKAQYYAPNMVKQFPALATRYLYDNDEDGEYGRFYIDVIRESKLGSKKIYEIPCKYSWETKELKRIDELPENRGEVKNE